MKGSIPMLDTKGRFIQDDIDTVLSIDNEAFYYAIAKRVEDLQRENCFDIYIRQITYSDFEGYAAKIYYSFYPEQRNSIVDGVTYTLDKNGLKKKYHYIKLK